MPEMRPARRDFRSVIFEVVRKRASLNCHLHGSDFQFIGGIDAAVDRIWAQMRPNLTQIVTEDQAIDTITAFIMEEEAAAFRVIEESSLRAERPEVYV